MDHIIREEIVIFIPATGTESMASVKSVMEISDLPEGMQEAYVTGFF
jgi:hypothetical protein